MTTPTLGNRAATKQIGDVAHNVILPLFVMATSRAEIAIRQRAGARSPILLIHAQGGSSRDFDALFASPIAADYRLIAIDLPGHGASGEAQYPEIAYTIADYADTVLAAIERLGIDNAFIIDLSSDGHVGRELATIFPGMLGLALLSSHTSVSHSEIFPDGPPVYEISRLDEDSLAPMLQNLELHATALALAPRLWYGG